MIIKVRVVPKSGHQKIEETGSNSFKVYLKSLPEGGKANKELIKFLSEKFDIPQSLIEIIKGKTSRNKIIKINLNERI